MTAKRMILRYRGIGFGGVMMRYPCRVLCSVLVIVAAASVSMAGQVPPQATKSTAAPSAYTPPRTPWGDPDLQGTWRTIRLPLERPEGKGPLRTDAEIADALEKFEKVNAIRLAGKGESRGFRANPNMNDIWVAVVEKPRFSKRTSGIIDPPDGRLPAWTLEQVKAWEMREAVTRERGEADTLVDRAYNERCIPHYLPPVLANWGLEFAGGTSKFGGRFETITDEQVVTFQDGLNSSVYGAKPFKIVQAPGYVVIMDVEHDRFRFVPLGKRVSAGPKTRSWVGDTYGYWQGDTLVVEVTNIYYEYPVLPGYFSGEYPGSGETLKVTERYKRLDADNLDFSFTVEDPAVWTRPYTVSVESYRDDNYKDLPSICHEVNLIDVGGQLATARFEEAVAWENNREVQAERDQWFQMRKKQAIEWANRAKTQQPSSTTPRK